jgi:CBS domain-containing protein
MTTANRPSTSALSELGSYLTPAWEHARVADAMRTGVMSCPPNASLRSVAQTMATHHVHAVVVTALGVDAVGEIGPRAWGIVTDKALARRGAEAADLTAGDVADPEVMVAEPDWPLARAAELMADHGVTHLVVVDAHEQPIGMLSTLDLAGIIAWGRG